MGVLVLMSLLLFFGGAPGGTPPPATALDVTGLQTYVLVILEGDTAWTDISADVLTSERFRAERGIRNSRPQDVLATSGVYLFALDNDPQSNASGLLGRYSPNHANVLPGWTYDIPVRVVFRFEDALDVTSITRTGGTATVTTDEAHGFSTGQYVHIEGADQAAYVGFHQITVTGAMTFTYAVSGAPASPATGAIVATRSFVKWTGKIDSIDPEPGEYGGPTVRVTCYDVMRDIIDTEVSAIEAQAGIYDDACSGVVLDALPADAQPMARNLDPGLDLYTYALHNLGTGKRAGTVLANICRSSWKWGFPQGDGTYRELNRNSRATAVSSHTFDDLMHGLRVPSRQSNVFTQVKTITHPLEVPASPVVVATLAGTPPLIPGNSTVELEQAYRDPNDSRRIIGAIDFQTTGSPGALVPTTDYLANDQEDGLGANITGNITVPVSPYGGKGLFSVTNGSATPAYLVNGAGASFMQLRGRPIYDNGPRTFRTGTGKRIAELDLPYLDNDVTGQQIADLIHDTYSDPDQIEAITILGNYSDTLMLAALSLDIGDVITVSETVTGTSNTKAMIRSVEIDLIDGITLWVRWGLVPALTLEPPDAPTSLTATVVSDSAVEVAWNTGQAGSTTKVYRQGPGDAEPIYAGTAGVGATALKVFGLQRATNYTFTAKHEAFSLESGFSNTDSARPVVAATGGDSTFDDGGYRYHVFTTSGNFNQTVGGRLDRIEVGGGGGGGGSDDQGGAGDHGGGGGGGGGVIEVFDDLTPAGTHAVVIGAGGAPGSVGSGSGGGSGSLGGHTSFRGSSTQNGGGPGAGGGTDGAGGSPNNASGGGGAGDQAGPGGVPNVTAAGWVHNVGGAGGSNPGGSSGGGAGGGAGSAGSAGTTTGGAAGTASSALFDGNTYAAGGVGGRGTAPSTGPANTGRGGGGAQIGTNSGNGFAGGSGSMTIRYPI